VVIVDNDEAMSICKMCYDIKNPTFEELNRAISSSLMSVFLPVIFIRVNSQCKQKVRKHMAGNMIIIL